MPCSRTPQWNVPARASSGRSVPPCLSVVPVLPPRSAEPPTRFGTAAAIAWSARPDAWRVASGPLAGVSAGQPRVPSLGQRAREPLLRAPRASVRMRPPRRRAQRSPPLRLERRAPVAAPSRQWSSASSGT